MKHLYVKRIRGHTAGADGISSRRTEWERPVFQLFSCWKRHLLFRLLPCSVVIGCCPSARHLPDDLFFLSRRKAQYPLGGQDCKQGLRPKPGGVGAFGLHPVVPEDEIGQPVIAEAMEMMLVCCENRQHSPFVTSFIGTTSVRAVLLIRSLVTSFGRVAFPGRQPVSDPAAFGLSLPRSRTRASEQGEAFVRAGRFPAGSSRAVSHPCCRGRAERRTSVPCGCRPVSAPRGR